MALKQAANGSGEGGEWYSNCESRAIKTVLRRLLSKGGELSIESKDITNLDEAPSAIVQRDEEFAEAKNVITVNADTGEVVNAEEVHDEQPQQAQKFSLS